MSSSPSQAQVAAPTSIDLREAIVIALENHPSLDLVAADEQVADARVRLAQVEGLPSLGVAAQLSRGTGNVVPGAFFAQSGLPGVSGPPTGRELDGGRFGSALGAFFTLDVSGLVQRMRNVDASLAEGRRSRAETASLELEVAYEAADAYLGVVDAIALVRVARASAERARAFATVVRALADQSLRPGADAARVDADVAFAEAMVVRAEQSEAIARVRLATALGRPGLTVDVDATLVAPRAQGQAQSTHPRLVEADAALEAARLRERSVRVAYLPRVELNAAMWLRGSGYFPGGLDLGAAQGILPDAPNWAVGVTVSWEVTAHFEARAREQVVRAETSREEARRAALGLALAEQVATARVMIDHATRIAANTAPALDAAESAKRQALARYDAGLTTITEIFDAERALAQAELDDASARVAVLRATLLYARALGDMTPFTRERRAAPESEH